MNRRRVLIAVGAVVPAVLISISACGGQVPASNVADQVTIERGKPAATGLPDGSVWLCGSASTNEPDGFGSTTDDRTFVTARTNTTAVEDWLTRKGFRLGYTVNEDALKVQDVFTSGLPSPGAQLQEWVRTEKTPDGTYVVQQASVSVGDTGRKVCRGAPRTKQKTATRLLAQQETAVQLVTQTWPTYSREDTLEDAERAFQPGVESSGKLTVRTLPVTEGSDREAGILVQTPWNVTGGEYVGTVTLLGTASDGTPFTVTREQLLKVAAGPWTSRFAPFFEFGSAGMPTAGQVAAVSATIRDASGAGVHEGATAPVAQTDLVMRFGGNAPACSIEVDVFTGTMTGIVSGGVGACTR